jgi:hypothetical protein
MKRYAQSAGGILQAGKGSKIDSLVTPQCADTL